MNRIEHLLELLHKPGESKGAVVRRINQTVGTSVSTGNYSYWERGIWRSDINVNNYALTVIVTKTPTMQPLLPYLAQMSEPNIVGFWIESMFGTELGAISSAINRLIETCDVYAQHSRISQWRSGELRPPVKVLNQMLRDITLKLAPNQQMAAEWQTVLLLPEKNADTE